MTSSPFSGSHAAAYADGPPRKVPGFVGLHKMTSQLLAERVPADGRVLVLGAGGGLELKALADDHAGWAFEGIDPSADMLKTAEVIAADHLDRIILREGYIESASEGPFDGATCILTFHFIALEQRLETLRQIRRRLKPGAPFVLAHISFSQTEPERSMWIARHVAFGSTGPVSPEAVHAMSTRLNILAPEAEEAMLAEAGFANTSLFYAGLSFRGWVAYAT